MRLLKSISHVNTTRSQLIQARREHVVNGNTVPSQYLPMTNELFLGKTKKPKVHLLRHYAGRLQKDGFLVFPRKTMVLA